MKKWSSEELAVLIASAAIDGFKNFSKSFFQENYGQQSLNQFSMDKLSLSRWQRAGVLEEFIWMNHFLVNVCLSEKPNDAEVIIKLLEALAVMPDVLKAFAEIKEIDSHTLLLPTYFTDTIIRKERYYGRLGEDGKDEEIKEFLNNMMGVEKARQFPEDARLDIIVRTIYGIFCELKKRGLELKKEARSDLFLENLSRGMEASKKLEAVLI